MRSKKNVECEVKRMKFAAEEPAEPGSAVAAAAAVVVVVVIVDVEAVDSTFQAPYRSFLFDWKKYAPTT